MQRKLIDKIKTSIWIIPSFVVFLNGLGFIYIGRKMSKRGWTLEGIIYEFPWIFGLFNFLNLRVAFASFSIGLALLIVSILRSFKINMEYQELLDVQYENDAYISGGVGSESQIEDNSSNETDERTDPYKNKSGYSYDSSYESKRPNPYDINNVRRRFRPYKEEILQLKDEFEQKNNSSKELVEKRFTHSKLTYDRFMSIIESSADLFYSQADYALDMIELTPEHTDKIEAELKRKIELLKTIIKKTDELNTELVINMTNESDSDDEMDYLIEDIDNLTKSVKDYE